MSSELLSEKILRIQIQLDSKLNINWSPIFLASELLGAKIEEFTMN